jgi:hypothetical protein
MQTSQSGKSKKALKVRAFSETNFTFNMAVKLQLG